MKTTDNLSPLRQLWSARAAAQFKELRGYIAYSLQSASLAFTLVMLLSTYGYRRFLMDVPPDFPLLQLVPLLMFPALAYTPIRTLLRDADLIYLLPLESAMPAYLRHAEKRAFLWQSALVIAVWLIVWPMHTIASGSGLIDIVRIGLVLLAGKKALLYCRWIELQQMSPGRRRALALLRWLIAFGVAWSQTVWPPGPGLLASAALLLLYVGLMRLMNRGTLDWTYLIELDKKQRAAQFRILNVFVDVPDIQGRARSIHAPAGLLRRLGGYRFQARDTFRYLYTRVWLRSEWFGITARLTLVGIVLTAVVRGAWAPAAVAAVFSMLVLIQLKELQKAYRHSDWSRIYPLPGDLRMRSALRVRLRLHLLATALLLATACFSAALPIAVLAAAVPLAAASLLAHRPRAK